MSVTTEEKPIETTEAETKTEEAKSIPEDLLRAAVSFAKEKGYTIERRKWYDKHCGPIRALLLQNEKPDTLSISNLEVAATILGVTSNWIRAFDYGYEANNPGLRGGDGEILKQPIEAFRLGLKLGVEFCGEADWKYSQ